MSIWWLTIYAIFFYITFSFCFQIDNRISFHYNNTYKYNVPYTVQVNNYTEYVMEFGGDLHKYDTPARVTVASRQANKSYPLFVTARQQKGVFSWKLPMIVQTPDSVEQFNNISRTLCPHNNLFSKLEETCDVTTQNIPVVHLTSSSPESIDVTIVVETVEDFYIPLNRFTNVTSTPSQPKYYFYPFNHGHKLPDLMALGEQRRSFCQSGPGNEKHKLLQANMAPRYGWMSRPKSVIVMIESDDDLCAVVSIQNYTCPVFDNERDILYDGQYLTMTRRGGITLTQETFPLGFYIVFIVKSSDEVCVGKDGNSSLPTKVYYPEWGKPMTVDVVTNDGRMKQFSFRIIETISYQEYVIAAGAILGFFLSFYAAFLIAVIVQRVKMQNPPPVNEQEEAGLSVPSIPYDNMNVTTRRRRIHNVDGSGESSSRHSPEEQNIANGNPGFNYSSGSDTESEQSVSMDTSKEVMIVNKLCLASLARCRPRVLSARSKLYLWNVFTVAVFYTLPVIQLVVTYQRMLNQSGNQDLCYYNFLCAHPLMVLSDFNHVYSNLGYVMLGILFLLQVWRRHNRHRARNQAEKEVGIPQHFGLLYAMGIALVSEGLLSAAYHVCPNSMNFQFDTSFMYVTSVLCMVKIYQSRHPDINARAHATFCVLALIIFIGLVGVLNANYYFWILFTILHLVTCLVMTFQIYYLGRFKLDGGIVYRAARELVTSPLAAITPTHCGRCILLLIANLANWIIAAYGMSQQSRDFASHLLLVLMSNLFLYTMFYIVMKLLHRESIRWYSWVFIALTYGTWFGSSYFYLDLSTDWSLTPAQSRQSNRVCSLLQLYDSHDIWHFLSSSAMFFSFNMYLTIDDNLSDVPREDIKVF